ncbi:hypothetical protein LCGC14_1350080 [marine sediment metagenome]|uniref:Uncharacterized protein n=1 Tax=marine sediment metagenome TaxID=412755 RepID=A0A0F9MS03_9ZZZZ
MSVIKAIGLNQQDLYNVLQALVNRILGDSNFAVGSDTTTIQVDAFDYQIEDQVYAKAAEDNVVVSLTDTGAGQFRKIRMEINAAGTLSFKEGAVASAQVLAPAPRRTAGLTTVGWGEIPASFVYATSNFNDGGVTLFSGDPDVGDGAGVHPNDRGIERTIYTGP